VPPILGNLAARLKSCPSQTCPAQTLREQRFSANCEAAPYQPTAFLETTSVLQSFTLGEERGNDHRTSKKRLPAADSRIAKIELESLSSSGCWFTEVAPGHLWPGAAPDRFSCFCFPDESGSVPAKPSPKGLWECKLTPPYCTCQEGNTIGCILNNDGLDAGVLDLFSTKEIHGMFTKVTGAVKGPGGHRFSGQIPRQKAVCSA